MSEEKQTTQKKGKKKSEKSQEQIEGQRELLRAVFLCVIAVVVVRSFLFEPFKIPSSSMVPTLHIGDHIFVSKFDYGLSIPFTKIELIKWGEPKRGDIIVFLFPRDESLHYIKRVVGIPGDKLRFEGKEIYINDQLVERTPVSDPQVIKEVMADRALGATLYEENLEGRNHFVRYSKSRNSRLSRINQEEVIPEGQYFVIGDNRDESYDSRSWGTVPREAIKGKARVIWLSLNQQASWGKMEKVRWARSGMFIK